MSEPSSLIVIVMNDSLAAIAVRIFLLDHGRAVSGLALLDDRGTIAVAVMIVRFADPLRRLRPAPRERQHPPQRQASQ